MHKKMLNMQTYAKNMLNMHKICKKYEKQAKKLPKNMPQICKKIA